MIINDNINNYSLIDIESMSIFESIDVRSVTSKPEFPSEEFGDFMELLAKWNLSDACGSDILKFSKKICRDDVNLPMSVKQGRQLLDQIVVPHISFKYTPLYHEGQRIYYEQYNGDWWERVQNSLPRDAKVLSIILYSDATTCNHLGKTSEHPIYLTLGNIISWRRNKPDAKILLGYLPQLKAKTLSEKRTESF